MQQADTDTRCGGMQDSYRIHPGVFLSGFDQVRRILA
jgi:hypothetical protein